jgi:hypothetical protein
MSVLNMGIRAAYPTRPAERVRSTQVSALWVRISMPLGAYFTSF